MSHSNEILQISHRLELLSCIIDQNRKRREEKSCISNKLSLTRHRLHVGNTAAEPVFLNVYGAQDSIPRN
jgi:hypothetical protein